MIKKNENKKKRKINKTKRLEEEEKDKITKIENKIIIKTGVDNKIITEIELKLGNGTGSVETKRAGPQKVNRWEAAS